MQKTTKEISLGWVTDRRDLITAVRDAAPAKIKKLVNTHMRTDPRAAGRRSMRNEQLANLLMLGLLEGTVPESAVILCAS